MRVCGIGDKNRNRRVADWLKHWEQSRANEVRCRSGVGKPQKQSKAGLMRLRQVRCGAQKHRKGNKTQNNYAQTKTQDN